jgi:kynureninase
MTIDRKHCEALDSRDPLASIRERFVIPGGLTYLDGNSLGCLPRAVAGRLTTAVEQEWGQGLIRSWNEAGWYRAPQRVGNMIGRLIGAAPDTVIVADSTSVNLFKVLSGALALRPERSVILGVTGDFPTNTYIAGGVASSRNAVFKSVAADVLLDAIDDHVAVVSLTQVSYRSGRVFDMNAITERAHEKGALIVWDLSHSAGVLDLQIGDSGADFAVGCGYKYLNGGPGAPAYVYLHPRHHEAFRHPLNGWLGHQDPFAFAEDFRPAAGIDGVLAGTPPILSLVALEAALGVFEGVDMHQVRTKARALTDLFIALVEQDLGAFGFSLASPRDGAVRGAQVSLAHPESYAICQALIGQGVVGDFRAPDILRLGFSPLTTRFVDVHRAAALLGQVMGGRLWDTQDYRQRKAVT